MITNHVDGNKRKLTIYIASHAILHWSETKRQGIANIMYYIPMYILVRKKLK